MDWDIKVIPNLLFKAVLPVMLVTFLLSLYMNNPLLFLIGCMFLSLKVWHHFYVKSLSKHLKVDLDKESIRMSIHDKDSITFHIQEESKLPLKGRLIINIDNVIESSKNEKVDTYSNDEYDWEFKKNGKDKISIFSEWIGIKRGIGRIRKMTVQIIDPIFMTKINLHYNKMVGFDVLIYPDKRQTLNLEQLLSPGYGEIPYRSSYFRDPLNLTGIQDYQRSDNFKDIHWKASARMGDLQTKVYEKVGLFQWTIILNVHGQHHYFSKETERNINMLTYICKYAIERNIPYEIYVNLTQSLKAFYLPAGEGKEHFKRTNEFLARLDVNDISIPINRLCFQIDNQKRINNTILFIGDQKIASSYLLKWKRKGFGVFTIQSEEKDIARAL
jgi:uncharacterized protein (DUF58 family)